MEVDPKIVIVYDRYHPTTTVDSLPSSNGNLFQYTRKPIYDQGLKIILIQDGKDPEVAKISRTNLAEKDVYFDADMVNAEWFELDRKKCYVIFQDHYFSNGSLNPSFVFSAYRAEVSFIPYH